MRVAVRDLVFDVHVGGPEGGLPVLLLHGFPQHSGMWSGVAPVLQDAGLRTYAMDQRGYSPSARPRDVGAYRMTECVLDAAAVLDDLGLDSAHVVGHDWGALVGWHLAANHPGRVRTLTAISVPHPHAMGVALATDPDQQRRSGYIQVFRQEGKAESLLLADGGERLRELFTGCPPDKISSYVEPLLQPGALTPTLNWYRALSTQEMSAVGPVTVPTTFVWGDQDLAIGALAAENCARFVTADYRFVPLPGISHWIPDQVPDTVAAEVLARVQR